MRMRLLLASLIVMVAFAVTPVTASDMPQTNSINLTVEGEAVNTIFTSPIYSIQESVMPFSLWSLLYIIGIILLLISIILHERGGIATGLMSLAFIGFSMLNSVFIGFTDIISYTVNDTTVVQPVVSVFGSHTLNLLVFLTFLVALLNVFLLIMTMLAKSPKIKPDYYGGMK